jgi:4-amino-4-deoxy-L-arabinose transferase-like glycosyltransferase
MLTWAAGFVLVAALLVLTQFTSDDPDSALYAALSARLAEGPVSRWIAPEWWGHWNGEGLFREHPAGVFLVPTALGRLGMPAAQAAYVVGVAAGLGSLVLIGAIVGRLTTRDDARAALVLLQLMPVAFIFRIRANHEYPMLLALLVTLIGLDGVRRSWPWLAVVALGLTSALLVKGVFVAFILVAAALWIALNPTGLPGSAARPIAALLVGLVAMVGTAAGYDAVYVRVTGESFWAGYWARQLGPLTIATPLDGASMLVQHFVFYVTRILWHPAPWSLALVIAAVRKRARLRAWWAETPARARRGLIFAIGFSVIAIGLLSSSSRFAERYAFSATYAIAAAGIVVASADWPWLRTIVSRLDARVPALPALVWLTLMLLRLVLGPYLPRIS